MISCNICGYEINGNNEHWICECTNEICPNLSIGNSKTDAIDKFISENEKVRPKTLGEVMPFLDEETIPAFRFIKEFVLYEFNERWIGNNPNVDYWCILNNGISVGYSENEYEGYSFYIATKKDTKKFLRNFR